MEFLGLEGKGLSILLVDDETISELNRSYLKKDGPTNIISFSYLHDPYTEVVGDIVVSVERVKAEAEAASLPFYERFFEVLIHGLLHILGFDDRQKKDRVKMKRHEMRLKRWLSSRELFSQLIEGPSTGH